MLAVNQDPWTGSQGPQELTASSFQDWSVTATDTDPSGASGEVLTYPDASFNYYQLNTEDSGFTTPPSQYDLNNISSLTSDFTQSMPQLGEPRCRGRIRHMAEPVADPGHGVGGDLAREGPQFGRQWRH